MKPDLNVLKQFGIDGEIIFLPGGEERTYRVGNIVLKHLYKDTLEYSLQISEWFSKIKEDGFRIPRPILTIDGKWVTENRWSAWTFLEGNHDYNDHIKKTGVSDDVISRDLKEFVWFEEDSGKIESSAGFRARLVCGFQKRDHSFHHLSQ